MEVIAGQPSWKFASDQVEAAVTQMGGQLGPVRFHLGANVIEPFSIAPWAEEKNAVDLPMLQALRGDFFCAPFGASDLLYQGENHPPHGETANAQWHFESCQTEAERTILHLSLNPKIRSGRVDKRIELRTGQTAIYCQHILSGMTGKMNFGHHPMLKFPESAESGHITTSPIRWGQVAPLPLENPAQGGRSALMPGASFENLNRVPCESGGTTDVSRYPARPGFEDLLMFVHQDRPDFAWTAVAFPDQGYVWFALKDPRVLQSTIFWISNGGRPYPPWNGRHLGVMGLEDVTSYFHYGLPESAQENAVTRAGFATSVELDPLNPLVVNYIMGVAAIPKHFSSVASIETAENSITLISPEGDRIQTPVEISHLYKTTP